MDVHKATLGHLLIVLLLAADILLSIQSRQRPMIAMFQGEKINLLIDDVPLIKAPTTPYKRKP